MSETYRNMKGRVAKCVKKLRKYFKRNWLWIVTCLIFGQYFALWLVPWIFSKTNNELIHEIHLSASFILIYLTCYLFLFFSFNPFRRFLRRYRNNFSLREIPFTYVDGFFFFLLSFVFSASFFNKYVFGHYKLTASVDVLLLLTLLALSTITWLFLITRKNEEYFFPSHQQELLNRAPHYYPDDPITDETEDMLDRKDFIEDLYDQIIKYPFGNSFVFGLLGGWGEGKTSVLNLLGNKLCRNKKVILFDFDPWQFSSQLALIENFYEGLYTTLNRNYFLPNKRKVFFKYMRLLTSGLKLKNIDFGFASLFGANPESFRQLHRSIEDIIDATGKKIVVFVDDIDRLKTRDEVHQVFKLVKLTAKFRNTIFVLSFDPNAISNLFKKETEIDKAFLEKIIQAQINLPPAEQRLIDGYLYYSDPSNDHHSEIDSLFAMLEIDKERIKEFENTFTNLYETKIKELFPTMRTVKRYLNVLYSVLPAVETEVCLEDFFILQLIQVLYPRVYQDIWKNRWFYIPAWGQEGWIMAPTEWVVSKEKKYKKINEHITYVIEGETNRELLLEMLKTIFFVQVKNAFEENRQVNHDQSATAYRAKRRITHPDVFPKYFMLKVSVTDISDKIVEDRIAEWNSSEPEEVELKFIADTNRFREGDQLKRLLERLGTFLNKITPSTAKAIITAIFKNINSFSKEGTEDFWQSEYDKAHVLMMHLINENVEEKDMEHVLIQVIRETPSIEHAISTYNFCIRERGGHLYRIYNCIKILKLRTVLTDRLEQHFIMEGRDVFLDEPKSFPYIIHQWATIGDEENKKVNTYLFELIDKNPGYIARILSKYSRIGERTINYNDLAKTYFVDVLYEKILKNYENTFTEDSEKVIVDEFMRIHEQIHESSDNRSDEKE